jgi:diguanylate cyclase (GGDEF)-like protein
VQLDVQGNALALSTAVPASFRILMRSPSDVVVIKRASWWTPTHALVVLALAFCATLLVLAWVVVLRRRVERQTILLRESEQRFRHMALHDALTGLATRLLLEDRLNAAVEAAKRHQAGLGLLMVDLDKFKETNDTFGHQAGDEVLRVTANRLLDAVRKSDTVARLGGDEFVVLLPDLRNPQMAERVAANIVKTLAIPISFEGREMPVSVSVGVCSSSAGELDADTLLKNADAALYRAKEQGRNCYVVCTHSWVGEQMESKRIIL